MDKFENPEGICANPFDIWEVFMCFKIPLKIKFLSLWQKKVKKTNTFQRSRILETHFSDMHPDITRQDVTFSYTPYCFFIISDHYDVTLGKCQKNLRQKWLALTYKQFTVWKKKNSLSCKNISWNQLFSHFFRENVIFMKFLSKKCEREFPKISQCEIVPSYFFFFVIVRLLYAHSFVPAPSFSVYKTLHSICLCDKLRCLLSFCNFQLVKYKIGPWFMKK